MRILPHAGDALSLDSGRNRKIGVWGWQNGLSPSPHAPVWPMESFRDRFLTTYSSQPPPAPSVVRP